MIPFDPDELGDADDRSALVETAARLTAARPLPAPGFRGDLRRRTLGSAGRLVARPPQLRRRVLAFVGAGAVLVGLAATGLAGHGPLARPHGAAVAAGHAVPGRALHAAARNGVRA